MEVFVTGATGVLGRPTTRLLIERGHRVRALARSERNELLLRGLGAEPIRAEQDGPDGVGQAVSRAEGILHLATRIPPTRQLRRPAAWQENDRLRREGTRWLVETALRGSPAALIYPSVVLVYPDSGAAWIDAASTAPAPGSILQSTLQAEAEVARFAAAGRRGVTLRMGGFYGPEAGHTRELLGYARRGLAGLPGADEAYQSAVWVEDAARAVVAALEGCPSGTYDVVDDEPLRRGELLEALAASVGRRRLFRLPAFLTGLLIGPEVAEITGRSQRVSNRRFKTAADWSPAVVNAREGLRLLVAGPAPQPPARLGPETVAMPPAR